MSFSRCGASAAPLGRPVKARRSAPAIHSLRTGTSLAPDWWRYQESTRALGEREVPRVRPSATDPARLVRPPAAGAGAALGVLGAAAHRPAHPRPGVIREPDGLGRAAGG